ncbi:MAG TPA: hypothetical protein PKC28_00610 [Bdellovibrionales bacterium]|nr:hypothetical protein [Bdellovibrionales bacterium]
MKSIFLLGAALFSMAVSAAPKKLEWNCSVVSVNEKINSRYLEEGLGSIYDITWDGHADADGDSVEGGVEIDGIQLNWRLMLTSKIVLVRYSDKDFKNELYAILDCSGGKDIRYR